MQIISTTLMGIGIIGTVIGIWFVYTTLRANHDWQRREYAMNIIRDWNVNTARHWEAIEDVFPHLRDVDRTGGQVTELTKQETKEIYTCDPDNEKYWKVRFHLVELMNYSDFIASAYLQQVADKQIVIENVMDPLIKWYDILKNFIEAVEICEGYQPWPQYVHVVSEWQSVRPKHRKPTA